MGEQKCAKCGCNLVGKDNPTNRKWNVDGKWVCEKCKVAKEKGEW